MCLLMLFSNCFRWRFLKTTLLGACLQAPNCVPHYFTSQIYGACVEAIFMHWVEMLLDDGITVMVLNLLWSWQKESKSPSMKAHCYAASIVLVLNLPGPWQNLQNKLPSLNAERINGSMLWYHSSWCCKALQEQSRISWKRGDFMPTIRSGMDLMLLGIRSFPLPIVVGIRSLPPPDICLSKLQHGSPCALLWVWPTGGAGGCVTKIRGPDLPIALC
jgi:hypothetical protein